MRTLAVWSFCLIACQWLAWAQPGRAQPPSKSQDRPAGPERTSESASDKPAAARGESVQEVQPPVLYLRSKDGSLLQAVLGFTLDDFERLLAQRAQMGLGEQPPAYRLEKLVCTGRAGEKHAAFSIQLRVVVDGNHWVRVPIGLGELVLRDKPKYDGPGQHFVEYDQKNRQYVTWFRGGGEQSHQLTLDGLAPLMPSAGRTELKLSVPRASASSLTLTVPLARAAAQVAAPAVLMDAKATGGATEFNVVGADPDFSISWHDAARRSVDATASLEAIGAASASVDGHSTRCDTKLSVRSFGGKFDRFRVRLPKGTVLVSGEGQAYTITTVPQDRGVPAGQGPLLDVQFREKTQGPAVVRLVTEHPHALVDGQPRLELGVPDVVGAVRQWGYLGVRTVGEWQMAWGPLRDVRQVDDLPQELRDEDVIAGFEYSAQPFALSARIFPRQPHRTVESRYTAYVDAAQVRLEARLTYRVRGAKVFGLEVDLPGWQLDEIGPRTLLDVDRAVVQPDLPLWAPLVQPSTGEIELSLRAHRAIAADATRVEFALPKPRAEVYSPAELTVVAADNVQLAPLEESQNGLSRQPGGGGQRLAVEDQRALRYRVEGPEPRFAANLRVESRVVRVDATSRIAVEEQRCQVEQTLDYKIANEPLDRLKLDVPLWWDESIQPEATVDGKPVELVLASDDEINLGRRLQYTVALPQRQVGPCQLLLRYSMPRERLSDAAGARMSVPLVMPGDGELTGNRLSVVAAAGLSVAAQDELWSRDETASPRPDGLSLVSLAAAPEVTLLVKASERRSPEPTVVERAWIQSWLGHGQRQDRAVFRFTSSQRRLGLKLPADVQPSQAVVFLDGAQAPRQNGSDNRLWIDLAASEPIGRRHVLEVTYRAANGEPRDGRLALEAPQWSEDTWVRHTCWQLVLPKDEYLLFGPSDMTSEFAWSWRGLHWARQPLRNQSQLEFWSGAGHDGATPQASNQYVFSTLGSVATLQVRTLGRSWLVLWASGGVLLAGLLLVYVPAVRRPVVLFVAALALVVVAAVLPNSSLVVAQAAALGLVLAVVGCLLQSELSRRRRRAVFVRSGGSSILEPPSTQSQRRSVPAEAVSVTESEPAEVHMSTSEGAS